jgi:PAS domain S-box-containing protein
MNIRTKGFLLVGVPLILQLIVVVTMSILLWQEQENVEKQASVRGMVALCNKVTQSAGEIARHAYPSPGGYLDAGPVTPELIEEYKESTSDLDAMLVQFPEQSARRAQLREMNADFLPRLYRARARKDRPNDKGLHPIEIAFMQSTGQTFNVLSDLIDSLDAKVSSLPAQKAELRQRIQILLTAAVGMTVLLTVALAYIASVGIRSPIIRMSKNAERISRREPLHHAMVGSDEVAKLDELFHRVDAAIEEALKQEHDLIDCAADVVCSLDEQGMFTFLNPYVRELLGYEPSELLGSSIISLMEDEYCLRADSFLNEKHEDGERRVIELQMKRKNQQIIDTSCSTIWSLRERQLFCVIHDTTERKQLERLKQDFIAMISHDLRTPLMSVHSSIELVQSGAVGEIETTTKNELVAMEGSIDHLIGLVNDLLDFEKLEAGRMDFNLMEIPVSDVLDESVRLIKSLSDERQISIELPDVDLKILGDQRKLIQVVVNLLSNALKHTDNKGHIKVKTQTLNDFVEISIHDEGPGVPAEFAKTIFAPFEQINSRATAQLGTGLGLAICKLIVQGHGGTIGVRQSEVLKGSAFYFTVPA